MTKSNLPWQASAILFWLPRGEQPTKDFNPSEQSNSSSPAPEPWWELHDAVRYAVELDKDGTFEPWIKTGEIILSPKDILEAYEALGGFGKK